MDSIVIEQVLVLLNRNFRDAVQLMAAARVSAHQVVARSAIDFYLGPLPVLEPAEVSALV